MIHEQRSAMTAMNNVNPARAGMIPSLYVESQRTSGKPRASGDDPAWENYGQKYLT